MSTALEQLKTMASPYEQSKLNSFQVKLETFKAQRGAEECQCEEETQNQQQEMRGSQKMSPGKHSMTPTQFAYQKAQDYKRRGLKADFLVNAATGSRPEAQATPSAPLSKSQYNEKFKPDLDYIYVPPKTQTHVLSMDKAAIGQTTYIPTLDQTNETLYRRNFLKTQKQTNETGVKANSGLEPVQVAYVVKEDGLNFAKLQSGRLAGADAASGLLVKNLRRVEEDVDVKEAYLEQFKRSHPEMADGIRPHVGGSVFTRKIKEEEWKEVPESVKVLKMDMRTTNRQTHLPASEKALELSLKDRQTSKAAFLKDHNGDNPVAGGVYHKPITQLQASQQILVDENNRRLKEMEAALLQQATESAIYLYNCSAEEADALVQKLSQPEKRQLAFLGQEAKRRKDEKWDQ